MADYVCAHHKRFCNHLFQGHQGMEQKQGYIFCTSNCAYTGLPLSRYEMMIDIWREYGNYDNWKW